MNFTLQDLVHYFLAAAGANPFDKPGIYLVAEEDNDLVEKLWTGIEIGDQVFIASGARTNSPAVYLLDANQRLVFFVSTHNILQCSRFDEEAEEWEEVNLQGDGPLAVHPASQLSGSFVPDGGQIVVFEDPSGRLQGIQISGDGTGEWVSLTPIPAQLRQGAAHTVILDDDECCHMLYIHCDNHIHHLTSGFEGGEWNDEILPGSDPEGDDRINSFLPIPTQNDNGVLLFEICALTSADKLIRINKEGMKTELGKVSQGRFTALSSEECVVETMRLIGKAINKGAKKLKG